MEIFDICPYYFYRVVEIIIRAEDGLSRDVVKHLNHVSMKNEVEFFVELFHHIAVYDYSVQRL